MVEDFRQTNSGGWKGNLSLLLSVIAICATLYIHQDEMEYRQRQAEKEENPILLYQHQREHPDGVVLVFRNSSTVHPISISNVRFVVDDETMVHEMEKVYDASGNKWAKYRHGVLGFYTFEFSHSADVGTGNRHIGPSSPYELPMYLVEPPLAGMKIRGHAEVQYNDDRSLSIPVTLIALAK